MLDHAHGVCAQPLRGLEQPVVDVGRGDAAPPGPGGQRLVEVELRGGLDDGVGTVGRAGSVGYGDVPRRREQHQLGRGGLERQTEVGAVGHPHAVGIEGFLFHTVIDRPDKDTNKRG